MKTYSHAMLKVLCKENKILANVLACVQAEKGSAAKQRSKRSSKKIRR